MVATLRLGRLGHGRVGGVRHRCLGVVAVKVNWDDVAAIVLVLVIIAVGIVVLLYVVDWLQTCSVAPKCGGE